MKPTFASRTKGEKTRPMIGGDCGWRKVRTRSRPTPSISKRTALSQLRRAHDLPSTEQSRQPGATLSMSGELPSRCWTIGKVPLANVISLTVAAASSTGIHERVWVVSLGFYAGNSVDLLLEVGVVTQWSAPNAEALGSAHWHSIHPCSWHQSSGHSGQT